MLTSSMLLPGGAGFAAPSPAGTDISNIAHIAFDLDGVRSVRDSNIVHTRVDEELNLTLQPAVTGTIAVQPGAGDIAVGFMLTNGGNGQEAFIPGPPTTTGGVGFVPGSVIADTNGNGQYDAGTDRPIPAGGMTPVLAPGGTMMLFVVGTLPNDPGAGATGTLTLPIVSATGNGPKGTVMARRGDAGGDAVVGTTTASASATVPMATGSLVASLVKSQNVVAPDGSSRPARGATITYRLEGRFSGNGIATGLAIGDPIPAGTTYVPASLTLDDVALTDTADGDAGVFDGNAVTVSLDRVPAPAVHVVTFKVRIQ